MKSCLGILLVFFTCVSIIGGGALIWYLSSTSEFSRAPNSSSAGPGAPQAVPAPVVPKPAAPASPFGERGN
jgi:hypothetical protein